LNIDFFYIARAENVYIPFGCSIILLFTTLINKEFARACQVSTILLAGYITIIFTEPGNLTGSLFILVGIAYIYQYGYFSIHFYRKMLIIFSLYLFSLIINLTFKREWHIVHSLPSILFTLTTIYLVWLVFNEEIKTYLIQTQQLNVQLDQYMQENTELSEIAKQRAQQIIAKNKELEQELKEKSTLEGHLRKTIRQKEILLREVHHRVKNNLTVMLSMLNLQLNQDLTDDMQEFIAKNKNRILTMATVHELNYEDQNYDQLELGYYLDTLANDISLSFSQSQDIKRAMDIEPLKVDQNTALSCGLVLNECITNSIKHGFKNYEGEKRIEVLGRKIGKNEYKLTIADNGIGFDGCIEESSPHSSFGIWLIVNIVEGQLSGTMKCENDNGTKWTFQFPENDQSKPI
jgi:two-component sensor histidine kinase